MAQFAHKYFCEHCQIFIFSDTLRDLAARLNRHNAMHHPLDAADWTDQTMAASSHYSGSSEGPLPKYLIPYGCTSREPWGDAKNPPIITNEDTKMLQEALIKW